MWDAARAADLILIHGYAVVDYALVWDAATTKLPALRSALADLLES